MQDAVLAHLVQDIIGLILIKPTQLLSFLIRNRRLMLQIFENPILCLNLADRLILHIQFLRCKMLVGKSQTLSDLHRTDAGCAFLQNAFWCAVEARSHHGSMIITGFEVSQ